MKGKLLYIILQLSSQKTGTCHTQQTIGQMKQAWSSIYKKL